MQTSTTGGTRRRGGTGEDIAEWLIQAGLLGLPIEDLLGGFCRRLQEAGFAIARAYLAMSTLHPLLRAYGYTWTEDEDVVETSAFAHAEEVTEAWLESPFAYMLDNDLPRLRRKLVGTDARLDFPVLQEFRNRGLTDWYAYAYSFGMAAGPHRRDTPGTQESQIGLIGSLASSQPGGFGEAALRELERLLPLLALAAKGTTTYQVAQSLLATYLGRDPAMRVLAGEIRRGSVQSLPAVLLYADLRGFTQLADGSPTQAIVNMLDGYFDCMVRPIERAGGEILKFMGDGLLATFAIGDRDRDEVCGVALDAAAEVLATVTELNHHRGSVGDPTMPLDLVVHLGDVLYGNVGSDSRLDFTVVGPAVNEASRMEALCRELGVNLLISETVASAAPGCRARLLSLGRRQLRGVRQASELFTLASGTSA